MIAKTQIRIELTVEEFEQITKNAANSGKSRNRYVIDCALNAVNTEFKQTKKIETTKPVKKVPKTSPKQACRPFKSYSKQDSAR